MDQSKNNLYKNSLYLATGIFVFLMCAATSSPAHSQPVKSDTVAATHAREIAALGRFVVTPSTTHFVAPSPTTTDTQRLNHSVRGAN